MQQWKDYYEILGVSPEASQEEIKKVYRELARGFHPDKNPNSTEQMHKLAVEKMKEINEAYDILGDPEKRKKYHSEWIVKKSPPKPVVDPPVIRFDNVPAKTVEIGSFVIRNEGGPYSEIWFLNPRQINPKSWVQVTKYYSLTEHGKLPLKVEISAEGADWGKTYLEIIPVRLDNEETKIRIELQTQAELAGKTTYAGPIPQAPPTPSALRQKMPSKWYFSTYCFVIAFLCFGPFALPLLWFNPRYKLATKTIATVLILAITFWLYRAVLEEGSKISTKSGSPPFEYTAWLEKQPAPKPESPQIPAQMPSQTPSQIKIPASIDGKLSKFRDAPIASPKQIDEFLKADTRQIFYTSDGKIKVETLLFEPQEIKLLKKAKETINSGNYSEAETLFKEVLIIDPENYLAITNLCIAYLGLNQPDKALEYAVKSLEKLVQPNILIIVAQAYQQKDNKEETFFWLEKALKGRFIATKKQLDTYFMKYCNDPRFISLYQKYSPKPSEATPSQPSSQLLPETTEKITIDSLTKNIPDTDYFVGQSKIFDASFDIAWNAANKYLKEQGEIDISDFDKGILTTKRMTNFLGDHIHQSFVLIEKISEDSTKVTVKVFFYKYEQYRPPHQHLNGWHKERRAFMSEVALGGVEKEIKKEVKKQEKQGNLGEQVISAWAEYAVQHKE